MSQAPRREVALRAFAREFNDATHSFRESDDDRAPVYVLLRTGAKANRVFIVGTLTETQDVGNEDEYWQGRVVDPTGTFFVYAGQYQPEVAGRLRDTEPPAYVAVVGKPRTYETDDGTVNVSLRPEHLSIVDEATRDRWVAETAQRTLDRIETFDDPATEYAQLARQEYSDTIEPYRQAVVKAMDTLEVAPNDPNGEPSPTDEAMDASGAGDVESEESESTPSDEDNDLGDFDDV